MKKKKQIRLLRAEVDKLSTIQLICACGKSKVCVSVFTTHATQYHCGCCRRTTELRPIGTVR